MILVTFLEYITRDLDAKDHHTSSNTGPRKICHTLEWYPVTEKSPMASKCRFWNESGPICTRGCFE